MPAAESDIRNKNKHPQFLRLSAIRQVRHSQINPSNLEIEAAQSNPMVQSVVENGFLVPFFSGDCFFLLLSFVIWNYHVHAININTTMPSQAQAKLIY